MTPEIHTAIRNLLKAGFGVEDVRVMKRVSYGTIASACMNQPSLVGHRRIADKYREWPNAMADLEPAPARRIPNPVGAAPGEAPLTCTTCGTVRFYSKNHPIMAKAKTYRCLRCCNRARASA
jgi:hypothetical protein